MVCVYALNSPRVVQPLKYVITQLKIYPTVDHIRVSHNSIKNADFYRPFLLIVNKNRIKDYMHASLWQFWREKKLALSFTDIDDKSLPGVIPHNCRKNSNADFFLIALTKFSFNIQQCKWQLRQCTVMQATQR